MSWKECPSCKSKKVKCIDSRWYGGRTRRRYQCSCGTRFSTSEELIEFMTGSNKVQTITSRAKDSLMSRIEQTLSEFSASKGGRQ